MPEFIVSWSAYGPSGRIEADTQIAATRHVEECLWGTGLETAVMYGQPESLDPLQKFDGDFIVIKSKVKRYGDMASFGVCVYEVGGTSFYDRQRDQLEDAQQNASRPS